MGSSTEVNNTLYCVRRRDNRMMGTDTKVS